jgi:hypothetical protein
MASKMPMMDWKHDPVVDSYKAFKARFNLFLEDNDVTVPKKQATKIKIAIGDEGMRRILSSGLTPDDQNKPDKIWGLLEQQLDATVKINFRVHRLEFSNIRQRPEEQITDFIARLREKANKCDFAEAELNERLIEMVILSTPFDEFRKELLSKPAGTPISDIIERGRDYEAILASQDSINTLRGTATSTSINEVRHQHQKKRQCGNCGLQHPPRSCPAFNDECHACGNMGHWQKLCRKTKGGQNKPTLAAKPRPPRQDYHKKGRKQGTRKHQDELLVSDSDTDTDLKQYDSIVLKVSDVLLQPMEKLPNEITANLNVQYNEVKGLIKLKVDTGAGGNALPLRTYKQMFGTKPTNSVLTPEPHTKLKSYSGHHIPCCGSIILNLRRQQQPCFQKHKFYVVDVPGPAILGCSASTELGIITVHTDSTPVSEVKVTKDYPEHRSPPTGSKVSSIDDLKWWYPDCFDKIGKFKEPEDLLLKSNAEPFIDPPRRCPISLKPKIKEELNKMENQGIIHKVTNHSDWCSSITYATKRNGSIRICLDPKKLNQALKRCPHKIPTVEEINPTFAEAKFFSKLDAKAGYWSVPLTPQAQALTTFRSPFGRYAFNRLPFGLSVSQDIFQSRMDHITSQCDGCVGISDDIVICGKTEEEHDARLLQFMNTARKEGLSLNSEKCMIKSDKINFFGRTYTKDGIKADPTKVEDISNMPIPQDKQDLQRFLGMATYLSSHIPNFSAQTAILRDLMKDDVPFEWSEDHSKSYADIKKAVHNFVTLNYYDPEKKLSLEVDASMKGLGAVLIQEKGPIAFASKALSAAQANYSNLERECLAIVHGIQHFHHYLFGRHFQILTDHKPLEMILRKPVHAAPPRLQRMLVKIQGYNFDINYTPGKQVILADTLSRLPNQSKNEDIELDCSVDLVNFSPNKQNQLRTGTALDSQLSCLSQVIMEGWPEDFKSVPMPARDFWSYRDELTVQNGIILKGQQVLIPETVRADILQQLHASHLGIDKTRRLARQSVFWPGINKDIERMCQSCTLCQELQPQQAKQPLTMHERPKTPWTKLGSDLFEINKVTYLILSDYFSRYPVVHKLSSTSATAIINATKQALSMFGVPREIVSDNGPQFGTEYEQFCDAWGIKHTTSSPHFPQSNGFIERQIKYIKPLMKKCLKSGGDLHTAMLHIRATPLGTNLPSPAELLFDRPIATDLPSVTSMKQSWEEYGDTMQQNTDRQVANNNGHRKDLPPLEPDQQVRVYNKQSKIWCPARVTSRDGEREYTIQSEDGRELRRNRLHLRSLPTTTGQKTTRSGRVIKTPVRYEGQ